MRSDEGVDRTVEATSAFLKLATKLNETAALERVKPALDRYRLGLFRLVVVGEVKKGKSSFINALLNEPELVPTSNEVATSTVFKVMYGDRRAYKVFFLPRDPDHPEVALEPLEINADEVSQYGTEHGNPDNEKGVEFIGVQLPNPFLKGGLFIIDTPGLGGLFRQHADITWRYLPNADAVFFILDSMEAVASREEMEALQRLAEITPYIFFLQTKTDLVDQAVWGEWQKRNLQIIGQRLEVDPEKIPYFPISSRLKQTADEQHSARALQRSGYAQLLDFFHGRLLAAKKERLGSSLMKAIAVEAAGFRRCLSDELHIVSTESKDGLDALEGEFVETKTRFDTWRETVYARSVERFSQEFGDLKRATIDRLQNELDPSPYGPLVRPIVAELRDRGLGARDIEADVKRSYGRFLDACSKQIFAIQTSYNQRVQDLIRETTESIGKAIDVDLGQESEDLALPAVDSLNMQFSRFEEARSIMYGGLAGGMMAGLVVGLVLPPASLVAGAVWLAGVAFGALQVRSDRGVRTREEALIRLQGMLSDACRVAQRQAVQQFNAVTAEVERKAAAALKSAATGMEQELKGKLEAVAEARKRGRAESQERSSELRRRLAAVDEVLRLIAHTASDTPTPIQRVAAPV